MELDTHIGQASGNRVTNIGVGHIDKAYKYSKFDNAVR
jgi:hypothetical protein